ncbi:hypothetical protein GO755_00245 [Spirosoma sp. HMF4905]|uniref:Uncharacterized protein n=1 Tax=Spirosoma arboris TaxID=2682092 RepID=A0A7K1S3R3_9BACT|nr:hypothetical protein [Spirosoma arboris]MVM28440.1 hypothetical protein [Spirosoma arboris]
MLQFKEAQDAPFAYILECCQRLPADRINTLDRRPTDLITGIVLTSSYLEGKPRKVELIPDMIRSDFDKWAESLRKGKTPVVGIMATKDLLTTETE